MDGFLDVVALHVRDNEYDLLCNGPDDHTSNEMRNLAQMGEFTPFVAEVSGDDWYAL